MGNGGFTMEYPPLHELASSRNRYVRAIDNFLTYLDPEPHRRTFLKPFMKQDSAEFCSSCHKVHLDVPVNNYRWLRGFNDYDNWQASGVSGQGARSFYYPPKTSTCTDCHMPLVDSQDPGNRDGKIHNHRFPGANMAVAHVNKDQEQLDVTRQFLTSGFISVDIFAAAPVQKDGGPQMRRRSSEAPMAASLNVVGEEAEAGGALMIREVGELAAPLNESGATFTAGQTVRLDVVVRTRKIGHFFPGGTIDSFDIWLELEGKDADGKTIFWSGALEEDGAVEPGAHFYRSFLLDGEGNPINKRNAWQARSAFYVRAIPPGAADTVHYRVKIPEKARGPLQFTAKLNYRKFSQFYNKYAFAGKAGAGSAGLDHDSREYRFDRANIPANVSGRIKNEIPVLPIVTLASSRVELALGAQPTQWKAVPSLAARERWNDWGIGLLLQGDLKGAEYAFKKVTEAEPDYADGWLNVARALIQEGETEAAKPYLAKARAINASLARIHFFEALVHKADGDYDAALASLDRVVAQYPRDRVAQNQIGRLLFLQRRYPEAIAALEKVLAIDPEDVPAHYTLMLAYRGLGDAVKAEREEKLFRRFKADESAQAITQKHRQQSAEDNNERQMIHEHESIPLPHAPSTPTRHLHRHDAPQRAAQPRPLPRSDEGGRSQLRAQQRPSGQTLAP
jgi:tetratricopeptide (TPR) repeat protein